MYVEDIRNMHTVIRLNTLGIDAAVQFGYTTAKDVYELVKRKAGIRGSRYKVLQYLDEELNRLAANGRTTNDW